MEEKFPLFKVRVFTEVINDSIAFARRYIKPIGYVILILVVPIFVIGSFFYASTAASAFDFGHTASLFSLKRFPVGGILGLLILSIGRILLNVIFMSAFISLEQSETGELTSDDIFRILKDNLTRLLGFYFLMILLVAIIGGIVGLVIAGLIAGGGTPVAVIVGLAAIVGLVYVSIPMSFVPVIYVREMCGFGEAISRSFYLVKHNWWWTFLILIVGAFIGGMAGYVFQVPYVILTFMKLFSTATTGHASSVGLVDRVALSFSNFGSILTTTVVTIVSFIQYYSLVEKKDGVNLMAQIDSIGIDENPII